MYSLWPVSYTHLDVYKRQGQLPIDAATGQMAEGAEAQARQSLENVKHILGEAGLTMANIVKTCLLYTAE